MVTILTESNIFGWGNDELKNLLQVVVSAHPIKETLTTNRNLSLIYPTSTTS